MSSTNRGYDRHASDYYVTPTQPIRDFLNSFFIQESPPLVNWLDPCAGGDKENEMSYPLVIKEMFGIEPTTIDIREDSLAGIKESYLDYDIKQEWFDIIITNPPFYLAKEIIQKALEDVKSGGFVVMLLRLNFWGSKDRNKWLKENMPKYCFIHGFPRMSFTKDGGTDSIEYAHFVWQKGCGEKFTKTFLL